MKNQALFSSKDKSKKVKMSSAAIFVWCFKREVKIVNLPHYAWCYITRKYGTLHKLTSENLLDSSEVANSLNLMSFCHITIFKDAEEPQ